MESPDSIVATVEEIPPSTRSNDPDRYFRTDEVKAELRGRTVRGSLATILSEGLKQVLWLVSTIVLARLLTPSDNGLIAMVLVVTGFIDLFNDLGLSAATIQQAEVNQEQISALFWINLAISIGLTLITIAIAPAIAWFYEESRLIWISIALSSGFVFTGLTVQHRALLRRQMHLVSLSWLGIAMVIVESTVGVVAALMGFGYWALVLMRLAWQPMEVIAIWIICPWRPSRPAAAAGVRSMLVFGGNLTGSRLASYLARNVDNLLIGRLYGPAQLGIYSKAFNLLLLPIHLINNPITNVAVPALSRLVETPARFKQAFRDLTAVVCLMTMPMVTFLIGTSDWVVLALLGPQWVEAGRIFAWLGLAGLVEPFLFAMNWLLTARGKGADQFKAGVISSIILVIAIVGGLPWGALGVAISYGITSLLIRAPVLFWYIGREGPVSTRDFYGYIAPFACAVITTLLAIWAFRSNIPIENPWLGLVAGGLITVATSLITLLIFPTGRSTLQNVLSIRSFLKKGPVA